MTDADAKQKTSLDIYKCCANCGYFLDLGTGGVCNAFQILSQSKFSSTQCAQWEKLDGTQWEELDATNRSRKHAELWRSVVRTDENVNSNE